MYRENNNKKVVLVSHSAGGLFAHYFLTHQEQAWKDTYIHTLVAIGTPWKGAALVARVVVSGFNFDISMLDSLVVRAEQRSSQVNILLMPKMPIWSTDSLLVSSPSKNYTLGNLEELFEDVSFLEGKDLLQLTKGEDYTFNHPGVKLECWFGTGIDTQDSFVYKDGFPDVQPSIIYNSDGDGTVPSKSARACELWNNDIGEHYTVNTKAFSNVNHLQLIQKREIFNALKNIVY